ncbi:class I SAM-dependent methyltransferase [Nannocystis sp.]|uniref:class I SAM-dependent rRNA methyltransferase n=1 Tax=Nannocystis sp. TaxID=1962667 RepID=UPI0025FE147C|nr:class I SAM-dependent methyltransferase [Nannocystis sp.]MBK7827328.1 class I SAM-dependent methyltransferase [Nannocystis sp.]
MTDRDRPAPRSAPTARGNDRGGNDRGGNDRGGNDRGGNDRGGNDRGGDRPRDAGPRDSRDRPRDAPRSAAPRDRSIRPSERPADPNAPAPRRNTPVGRRPARPTVRGPSVKVPLDVARLVRAGHPWVFRHTVRRDLDNLSEGAVVPVIDEDGYGVGWGLVEAEGAIGVRMLSLHADFSWNEAEMLTRIRQALRLRGPALLAQGAVRLLHGEADGFPGLALDRLGDYLLLYKYARCAESYLDTLVPLLEQELKPAGIYLQDRIRSVTAADDRRPPAFHLAGKAAPPEVEVGEDGLKFLVDVTAPVSPGLFLDLREGRRLLETLVRGRSVCNLFSFTGAFGLRAVRAGAAAVTHVDSAARSHARCRQNLAASGMDPEAIEAITGDVFTLLEKFRQRGRVFDFIVVDPPPFSNVKGNTFSALKDWNQLMAAVAGVVSPGGHVLAISNAVRLPEDEFFLALGEGVHAAKRSARLVGECGLPPDFPVPPAFVEGRYLKIKLLQLD